MTLTSPHDSSSRELSRVNFLNLRRPHQLRAAGLLSVQTSFSLLTLLYPTSKRKFMSSLCSHVVFWVQYSLERMQGTNVVLRNKKTDDFGLTVAM